MGYLLDINNELAAQGGELSELEHMVIVKVVDKLLDELASNVLETANSYVSYGAPAAVLAANSIVKTILSKKIGNNNG